MRRSSRMMNLNVASKRELTQLPRIGADKARRIVHCRATRRGFRDWLDFGRIPGITDADIEAIRSRAWIGPPGEALGGATVFRQARRAPKSTPANTTRFWPWRSRAARRARAQQLL